jgi:hypothetical protein
VVISNPTWTVENNTAVATLTDYPRGFKVFGTITDISSSRNADQRRPIYLFIHRNDNNRMYLYETPQSASVPSNTDNGIKI